ncbi:MAG: hypothetical protein Q9224_004887 [Gallowayella concinna]
MFALFKTYGIPSISSLLVKSNQLAGCPLVSSKRYADTGALLLEAVLQPPGSDRSVQAIARINYLHDRHRKRGMISDEDMLFTLSLFALEPMRWVKKMEWRELDDLEICAVGTLWKYLGDALKVPYGLLPSGEKGWKNAREWVEELDVWSRDYEEKFMVPAKSNHILAEATLWIILCKLPKFVRGCGRNIFAAGMEKRLREAMLIPPPPFIYTRSLEYLRYLRRHYLRHFCLPRFIPLTRLPKLSPTNPNRMNLPRARMHPWYIRPTLFNRWGLQALLARWTGEALPGDDERFMPEGFLTRELGPPGLIGKGGAEQEIELVRVRSLAKGGRECPFLAGDDE